MYYFLFILVIVLTLYTNCTIFNDIYWLIYSFSHHELIELMHMQLCVWSSIAATTKQASLVQLHSTARGYTNVVYATGKQRGILFVARVARIQPIAEASYRMTSGPRIPARLRVQSFSARPTSMFQVSTAFFFFYFISSSAAAR